MTRTAPILLALCLITAALAQDTQPAASKAEETAVPPTQAENYEYAILQTTLGDIVLQLDAGKAPISTQNFLEYVAAGHYNGMIFHRVMKDFMIQGGGYTPDLTEKKEGLRPPIKNEWQNGLKNVRGSIAMARTQVPDSATAQFYINVVDNPALDQPRGGAAYAVFGKVLGGLSTVDAIRLTPVKNDPKLPMGQVVPVTPVVIKSARKLTAAEAQEAAKHADASAEKAAAEAKAAAEKQITDYIAKAEQETGKKFQTTPSGLRYLIVTEGSGPSPQPTDKVEVNYAGTFLDGSPFDSGQAIQFPLTQVIKGWTEGVGLMKVGGKAKLICPPGLAYGERGSPPKIPPNTTLAFDVELLAIKTPQ
jgi:peptidyl-prolyl cis-trans isomerase A (cyclophilin A)